LGSTTTSCNRSPARQILEPSLKRHHQFTEHTAGTWPTQGMIKIRLLIDLYVGRYPPKSRGEELLIYTMEELELAVLTNIQQGTHSHTIWGDSGSSWFGSYGSIEGKGWFGRENVVGKVFPCEDKGGRGITVAVASGVATWLLV